MGAKGAATTGVRAVIAKATSASIVRTLGGMGILPANFLSGENARRHESEEKGGGRHRYEGMAG